MRLIFAGRMTVALPLARSHTPGAGSALDAGGTASPRIVVGSGYAMSMPSKFLSTVCVGLIVTT